MSFIIINTKDYMDSIRIMYCLSIGVEINEEVTASTLIKIQTETVCIIIP